MSLAAGLSQFSNDLADLWDNADESTTIFETGDLIQAYWEDNARVTGYEVTAPTVVPAATYAALSPLTNPNGTAATAAAAFEAACVNLVTTTLFSIIPPPFTTPPPYPVPAGPAIPGTLTGTLTTFFGVLSSESKAAAFAAIIGAYMQAWLILVTVPPSAAAPVPII